jgi:alkylation response protein AidB-like acyl-CoA dehydrogenase
VQLRDSPSEQAFREELRAWLAEVVPSLPPTPSLRNWQERRAFDLDWQRRLYDGGYAGVSWPKEYGGRDASLFEWLIFEEEYYAAGLPQRVAQNGIFLLAPTVFEFGTPEQRDRILPRMAAVEDVWAQGWSEPNAGSDLAGIASRAVRDDGRAGWRLSGQKTWTSRGAFCSHLFGLFRTDPDAERHRGMTYFLVPLDADGVTVRPVDVLDGDAAFAEVFLDDVFVPDDDVLGEVNRGWEVAMATTGSERGLSLRSPGRFSAEAERLVRLYRSRGDHGDGTLRDAVVQAWMDAEAYRLNTLQTVTRLSDGARIGPESSLNKVFWSEMDIALHEAGLRLLGDEGERADTAWMKGFLFSLAGPIYAGTNEIQRNVIAERVLGLPRK